MSRERPFGYTPDRIPRAKLREGLRNQGFSDGKLGRPKRSQEPEYLASYRRGKEAAAR